MSKQSGLGDNLYVDGYDLSGDIGSLSRIAGGNTPLDVTAINKSAFERLGGLRDGGIDFVSYFNDAAGAATTRLKTLPTTDVIVTYARGTTLGNPGAALVAKQVNYDGTRGNDGSLTFATSAVANGYGLEWGRQMTAGVRQDTAATNGTSVDFGTGSTTFGLQMYVHLFAFTGTSVTIKVQESSDDGAVDLFADVTGATTGALSAVGAVRVATANNLTVERYLRVVTTGTFSVADFSVVVVRNDTSTVF